jgi:3-isopropylmalate/(R)-2-methylmalate dehydratase small subunit
MEPLNKFEAVAAPLPMINIDTDMIIPKQFLKTIKRTGLGVHAFDEMRYDEQGREVPEFVLNQNPYRKAGFLITGENFGCGSSREHAPWALLDFGLRCIIAPGFADIFYNNCFKNGILPMRLPQEDVDKLMQYASEQPNPKMSLNLEEQTLTAGNHVIKFDIEPFRKQCLLEGLDDIGQSLQKVSHIDAFEEARMQTQPWVQKKAG